MSIDSTPPTNVKEVVALAEAIQHVHDSGVRTAMTEHLLSRVASVSPGSAAICGAVLIALGGSEGEAVGRSLIARLPALQGDLVFAPAASSVDILLLTVKPPELEACLAAFRISATDRAVPLGSTGLSGWFIERGGKRILITMAGLAGNVHAALVLSALCRTVDPRAAILVGMAAGLRDKVAIGDVVVAEQVLEWEFARMTSKGPLYQSRAFPVKPEYLRSAEIVPRNAARWAEPCREVVAAEGPRRRMDIPTRKELNDWFPEVHLGVVLAGAKLLEDGSLPRLRKNLHDRVRAAEMEGAGFAAACEANRIPWMVVRGIADHAEPDRAQGWQFAATVGAASFVREGFDQGLLSF